MMSASASSGVRQAAHEHSHNAIRVLIVAPPDTAYGQEGKPPDIKGDATLVFVVDVLDVG